MHQHRIAAPTRRLSLRHGNALLTPNRRPSHYPAGSSSQPFPPSRHANAKLTQKQLGCGTALPSLVLFQHALAQELGLYFTLCDYNAAVLRLVTLPNLLLTWALHAAPEAFDPRAPSLPRPASPAPPARSPGPPPRTIDAPSGDLHVTPALTARFLADLASRGLTVTLLSGPWSSPVLASLVPAAPGMALLALAAETVYSPASCAAFTDALVALLRRAHMAKALVAAKRVYFGVGGGVDAFREAVGSRGGVCGEVENSGVEGCERALGGKGVGRALLEVQMC